MYSYIRTHSYCVALFILGIGILLAPSAASAACIEPAVGGNYTVSSSCTFDTTSTGGVHGVDNGGMTIASGVTLTVNAGQTIVWSPGSSLVITGAILISSTGQLRQTNLWVTDADADGYPDARTYIAQDAAPTNGVRRNTVTNYYTTPTSVDATGGTITTSGNFTIHTFTTSGTFTPANAGNVEYLVVGGGGGGGTNLGGGGGAGGFRTATGFAVTAQAYTITVGAGGAGSTASGVAGTDGNNSVFDTITSTGGGGGGSRTGVAGRAGGSGGGGSGDQGAAGAGTSGQGNAGGTDPGDGDGAGGGGGASAVGGNGGATGGTGGAGTASSISGSSVTYAGGGGGGTAGAAAGAGGAGGGGAGSSGASNGVAGTANTGGGGGGGSNSGVNGGNGGSGIVIIRYEPPVPTYKTDAYPAVAGYQTTSCYKDADGDAYGAAHNSFPDASTTLATNLVSYWKLDETSGTSAADSKGTNTGTLTNGPTFAAGKLANGVSLDGVGDYIAIPGAASLTPTTQITIAAWVKPIEDNSTTAAQRSTIFGISGLDGGYSIYTETVPIGGVYVFRLELAGVKYNDITSTAAKSVNAWDHIVATYDGSTQKLYRNGILDASTARTGNMTYPASPTIKLGGQGNSTYDLEGLLDEVAIWDKALTATEVTALYNAGNGTTATSPTVSGDSCGTGYVTPSLGTDCLDSNVNVYQNVASLITDADNDSYPTATAAATQCVGTTSTINTRVYYKNASAAFTWCSNTVCTGGTDPNDANAAIVPVTIPSGVIMMWPGTNASIPAGWARETTLDDRFVKGTAAGVNPNVTGGAATHTHTSPGHTHTIATHTHAGTTGGPSAQVAQDTEGVNRAAAGGHTHTFTSGTITANADATTATFNTANGQPAFFGAIFIKSDGTPTGVPDTGVAFKNSSTIPTSWIQHVASKSRFILGAIAGGDGGGTGGGSHTHTAVSHTHPISDHLHGAVTSSTAAAVNPGNINNESPSPAHNHSSVTFGNSGGTSGGTASESPSSTTYEPSFYTLFAIQNNKGSADLPANLIGMWLGTLASIPSGWQVCDGTTGTPDLRSKFIKAANVAGDLGVTGGSDGHGHTDPAGHTHATSHTHSVSTNADTSSSQFVDNIGTGNSKLPHTHSGTTDSTDPGTSSVVQTVDSVADSQPPFTTVAYICNL